MRVPVCMTVPVIVPMMVIVIVPVLVRTRGMCDHMQQRPSHERREPESRARREQIGRAHV